MIKKYLENNSYCIYKTGNYQIQKNENDIISIKMIKDSIKALKTLFDISDYKIIVRGFIGYRNAFENIEVLKLNNTTIEIMDYNRNDELIRTKVKVNEVEFNPAIPSLNLEESTFYNNFIDRVEINFKI